MTSTMPPQVRELVYTLASIVKGYVLALAGEARETGRCHYTFPQPIYRSIEVSNKDVVD